MMLAGRQDLERDGFQSNKKNRIPIFPRRKEWQGEANQSGDHERQKN
jgi:hypothetical protein